MDTHTAGATSKLSGHEKAAILLRAIGEDAAATVLKHLDPKDIRKVGMHLVGLSNISHEMEAAVIQEFHAATSQGGRVFEGREYVKTVLNKALGQEKAGAILPSLTPATYPGLESLKWLEPRAVSQLVKAEHPQTTAVILAHLDPEQASQVLAGLPEALRNDVALRLATMEEVQPEMVQHLSEAFQDVLRTSAGPRVTNIGGREVMADILTRLDKATEASIMAKLSERDAGLAENVRSLMFVFDDLVGVDDRAIQEVLKEASKDELPLALKAASPEVREKILKNMSTRAADMLKEDMEARGPVKLSDADRAQQNILKICRRMEEEGRIVLRGQGEAMV